MMDAYMLNMLAQISACNARVEGMKASNAKWAAVGGSPAYDEDFFDNEARTLEHIGEAIRKYANM